MLVVIGNNWVQSLMEGKHDWALLELQQADEHAIPFLPVFITRTHNEHDDSMRWSPVERQLEPLLAEALPAAIPRNLLTTTQSTFGTMQPRANAERIRGIIGGLVPELREVSNKGHGS